MWPLSEQASYIKVQHHALQSVASIAAEVHPCCTLFEKIASHGHYRLRAAAAGRSCHLLPGVGIKSWWNVQYGRGGVNLQTYKGACQVVCDDPRTRGMQLLSHEDRVRCISNFPLLLVCKCCCIAQPHYVACNA